MEHIFVGFEIGLLIAVSIYIIGHLTHKPIPWLRTGLIILTAPLLLVYHFPLRFYDNDGINYATMDLLSVVKVIGSTLLLAIVISSIAQMLHSIYLNLSGHEPRIHINNYLRQALYLLALLMPILIIFLTSTQTVRNYYEVILRSLAVAFGLWVALKLFWSDKA